MAGWATSTSSMSTPNTPTCVTGSNYYAVYHDTLMLYYPNSQSVVKGEGGILFRNSYINTNNPIVGTTKYEVVISDDSYGSNQITNSDVTSAIFTFPMYGTFIGLNETINDITSANIKSVNSSDVIHSSTSTYYLITTNDENITFAYNSNNTCGSLTKSTTTSSVTSTYYCNTTSATAVSHGTTTTVPSAVSSSKGKYNSTYKGISSSSTSISNTTTFAGGSTYYAYYSSPLSITYINGTNSTTSTSSALYRNEYFDSDTTMSAITAASQTTSTQASSVTLSGLKGTFVGLALANNTTTAYAINHANVTTASSNSCTTTYYAVSTFSQSYAVGANVSSIGTSTGDGINSCKATTSAKSCSVTLPSITPNTGYTSAGWSTTNGATTGTAAGSSYTLTPSNIGQTLYANAVPNTYTLTANANGGTISSTNGWTGTGATATKSVTYGEEYSTLPDVAWTDHIFKGWYDNGTGGNPVSSTTTMGAAAANIYASWYNATATVSGNTVSVDLNATDTGASMTYGYAISTSATCDDSLSFTTSDNANYNFNVAFPSSPTTYYVCVRVTSDSGNNTKYVASNSVVVNPKPFYIYYNVNSGTLSNTDTYFAPNNWIVLENVSGSTNYAYQICEYGETCNVWDYDDGWLITRSGYMLESGSEWKARQGTSGNYTYTPIGQNEDLTYGQMLSLYQRDKTTYYEVNLLANWVTEDTLPIRVYYNANGGTAVNPTTYYVGKNNWMVTVNDPNSTAYVYETVNSGGTLNLYDYNNTFKLQKTGMVAASGAEWKLQDGSRTFNQAVSNSYALYKAAATKKSSYYELDLYVNWVESDLPYCTNLGDCEISVINSKWRVGVKKSTTVTLPSSATVDYFLVGGGGSGGTMKCNTATDNCAGGGGGGGGNVVTSTSGSSWAAGSYTVTVGAGGVAPAYNANSSGGRGGTSMIKQGSTTIASAAGGYGGGVAGSYLNQASGGATGGSGNTSGTGGIGAYWTGSGTSGGHSSSGGNGVLFSGDSKYTTYKYGAGGGGAGASSDVSGGYIGGVVASSGGSSGAGAGCSESGGTHSGNSNSGSGGGGGGAWCNPGTGGTGYVVIKQH